MSVSTTEKYVLTIPPTNATKSPSQPDDDSSSSSRYTLRTASSYEFSKIYALSSDFTLSSKIPKMNESMQEGVMNIRSECEDSASEVSSTDTLFTDSTSPPPLKNTESFQEGFNRMRSERVASKYALSPSAPLTSPSTSYFYTK